MVYCTHDKGQLLLIITLYAHASQEPSFSYEELDKKKTLKTAR